jgi:glucosamine-6-phosphate deaminase
MAFVSGHGGGPRDGSTGAVVTSFGTRAEAMTGVSSVQGDGVRVDVSPSREEMGRRAAAAGAEPIRRALAERGRAVIILATGASQFQMLDRLVAEPDIDWTRVVAFHLDEYAGMSMEHPASFRRYLRERFVDRLPGEIGAFHYIDAEHDPAAESGRLDRLIAPEQVDVAFIGIGENGHLAFNDPPADFDTPKPYLVVQLDEACRRQQLGEGWFPTLADVPTTAVSMSVRQIMKSASIICTVPDSRKAKAVREALEGPVTPRVPASMLQRHSDCRIFLDRAAASGLQRFHAGPDEPVTGGRADAGSPS